MPFKNKTRKQQYDAEWAKTPAGRAYQKRARDKFKKKLKTMPEKEAEYKRRASESAKRYYRENRDKISQRYKEQLVKRTKITAEVIAKAKESGCKYCPETEKVCLEFHHRDPDTKTATISYLLSKGASSQRILRELELCDVICANCHRKHHLVERRDLLQNAEA